MREKSLNQQNEKYYQLFLQSPSISMLIDAITGEIVQVNQAAEKFYGYSVNEFKDMKIFDLGLPGNNIVLQHMQNPCQEDGRCLRNRHKLKNGEIRDIGIFSNPVRTSEKELYYCVIIDLTMSLRIKEELEQSKERLNLVIEGAKAGIWDWDMVQNCVFYDSNWKGILGYADDEIKGGFEEWQNRWHPDDVNEIIKTMQDYLEGKTEKYEIEHRLLHKDGSYRWIFTTGKITRDNTGKPIRWVGSNIDISAQKEVIQIRLESEKKLKDFAQAIPDVSAIIDEEGRFVEIFGNIEDAQDHEIVSCGQTFHDLLSKDLADRMLYDIQQTIQTGKKHSFIREIDFDSFKGYFEVRTSPMNFRSEGKRTAAIIVSNITDRLKTEELLKFSYELQRRSDFLNDVISEKINCDEHMIASAAKWGINFDNPLYCCLIGIGSQTQPQDKAKDLQNYKKDILALLGNQAHYIVWDNHDKIGILLQGLAYEDVIQKSMTEAQEIKRSIYRICPELKITIGVSDINQGPASIQKSYSEAWNTLIAAQCQANKGDGISHYRDMGLFQILATLYGKNDTSEYVKKMIGPIIRYDREKGTELLNTLEEVLQGNNMKDTAHKMFIHHKTLVFRKQRIEKILGLSLEQFETRMALAAAIKLHKLDNINR